MFAPPVACKHPLRPALRASHAQSDPIARMIGEIWSIDDPVEAQTYWPAGPCSWPADRFFASPFWTHSLLDSYRIMPEAVLAVEAPAS